MEIHNLIKSYFDELDEMFVGYFSDRTKKKLPFQKKEHEWLNNFYKTPVLRHSHLEYYKTDRMCVFHINCFPDLNVDLPILGFDMIALGNKITGLFFDFTPTVTKSCVFDSCLTKMGNRYKSEKRKLPEWANFFSDNFYCVSPLDVELTPMLEDIKRYINHYLESCKSKLEEYNRNKTIQNLYCMGQKKNDKTYKSLAAEIGEDNAKLFLSKYLFPEVA